MKGNILYLFTNGGGGIISGDDKKRYSFLANEWKSESCPVIGIRVKFKIRQEFAIDIYCDKHIRPIPSEKVNLILQDNIRRRRYEGIYCSSNDKWILGLCGGLAHKLKMPVIIVRVVVFLSLFYVIGLLYFIGIFLPKLPTK